MGLIDAHLRNHTSAIQALGKFISCDVRNKYCAIEQTLRSCSDRLIKKDQKFKATANIFKHKGEIYTR